MFKVIWDKPNNGVCLTMSSAGEALNVCPRPVFWEELDFLGMNKLGWQYPHCKEPLMWACEHRYFYKGEMMLEIKVGDLYTNHEILYYKHHIAFHPVDLQNLAESNKDSIFLLEREAMHFIDREFKKYSSKKKSIKDNANDIDYQALARKLEKKTGETMAVVKEDCDSFDVMPEAKANELGKAKMLHNHVDIFAASFSGGKDSLVLLDLLSRTIAPQEFVVIYSDTGYELSSSLEHYEQVKSYYTSRYPTLKFYTALNNQQLMYYWDKLGSPSRVLRWCCTVMKSAPLSRKLKELTNQDKQPKAIVFDGVRQEESIGRANRARVGVNVKHNNIVNISPILYWNATEVYLYLFSRDLPMNTAYRMGFARVGCVICPYSSKWSENLASKLFPSSIFPFVCHIEKCLKKSHVEGIKNYIQLGKWKERSGGRSVDCESNLMFAEEGFDLKAVMTNPRENIMEWLKVLGEYHGELENKKFRGVLNHHKTIIQFTLEFQAQGVININFKDIGDNAILKSHIKRVLYKATYCIHCEVCEVECPFGALSVVGNVRINNKCMHCMKCIDFDEKGCISASCVCMSTGEKTKNMQALKSGINHYNDGMGLRDNWLKKYFETYSTFFKGNSHGLNPRYQIPPFINWIREACIINEGDKEITALGLKLAEKYNYEKNVVWEIIFINLCENSEVCKWFHSNIDFNRGYLKEELESIIQNSYPTLKDRSLKNPLNSLLNTFKEGPLGKEVSVGVAFTKDRKPGIIRHAYNSLSLVATAYSLYRYAEKRGRHELTVSEFYHPEQKEGIYRQFGISRETLENNLRSLDVEHHHLLRAELRMGLDNIILRHDINSQAVIEALL